MRESREREGCTGFTLSEKGLSYFRRYACKEGSIHTGAARRVRFAAPDEMCRLGHDLLPRLDPENPRMQVDAALREILHSSLHSAVRWLLDALQLAERRWSDFSVALGGYTLASWMRQGGGTEDVPPSRVLHMVRKARAAFQRCKELLPKVWVARLEEVKSSAASSVLWLEELVPQGDSWPSVALDEAIQCGLGQRAILLEKRDRQFEVHRCSGCGNVAGQLKVCTGCLRAKYCR